MYDLWFDKIPSFAPKITAHSKDVCEKFLSVDEFVLKKALINKSPGPGSLPFEIHKVLWDSIKDLVFEALKECE